MKSWKRTTTRARPSKNGEPIDHEKEFYLHFKPMAQLIQSMSLALGKVEKLPAAGARRCMNELAANFKELLGLYKAQHP